MITKLQRLSLTVVLIGIMGSYAFAWQDGQQPFDTVPGGQEPIRQPIPEGAITIQPQPEPETTAPVLPTLPVQPTVNQEALVDDEVVMVREDFAGWQAAGAKNIAGRVGNVLRANWVMADPNGRIQGQVYTIGSATLEGFSIYLLKGGRLITSARVNEDGTFEFTNVVAGAYSLVGQGDNAFFAFSFNAIGYLPGDEKSQVPQQLNVTAFQNKSTINLDWVRYFSPKVRFRVFGRYSAGEGADDPAHLYGYEGIEQKVPVAAPATSIFNHQVKRANDGLIRGRVRQFNSLHGRPVDLREAKVMLLQEDAVLASTTTDLFGVFEFEGVPSGEYAVVAAGVDGLGCIGISVSDQEGEDADMIDFTMASSETVGWLNQEAIDLAYNRAILRPRPKQADEEEDSCPNCGVCGPCGCGFDYFNRPRRRGLFQKVNEGINDFFDIIFYPEDNYYGNGTGYGQGYGMDQGYGIDQGYGMDQGYGIDQGFGQGYGYGQPYGSGQGYFSNPGYGPGYGWENYGYGAYQNVMGGF